VALLRAAGRSHSNILASAGCFEMQGPFLSKAALLQSWKRCQGFGHAYPEGLRLGDRGHTAAGFWLQLERPEPAD
jgi:hypothetical protein